jgi:glycosyltransferase involved in cell wall biosynthesis
MRIVVVQSGQFDHFLSAARAVGSPDGSADLIALVKSQDLNRAKEPGLFAAVEVLPDDPGQAAALDLWKTPIDLCVLPFEDRLGLRYFTLRLLLIGQGITRVVTYNRLGRLREYGRVAWLIQTLVVCLGIRAIHQPVLWLWRQARRRLDVAALFALAVLALPLSRLKAWGLYPAGRAQAGRSSSGAQRLLLFIPSMGMGGAQRQLLSFLTHLDRAMWEPELVTLDVADKFFEQAVRDLQVPVVYLNPRQDFWMVEVVWRLFRHLRRQPPVVLHSWLHYAVMLGAVAGTWAGVPVVIGSLRSQRPGRFPWFYPKWQRGMDILTAPLQTTLIANSNAVAEENRDWAFIPSHKLITVYNGIELEPEPDAEARSGTLRDELGLPPGAPVVGIVGRLFPEKDHATFLRAAALIGRTHPEVRFLIVGDGVLRGRIEREIAGSGLDGTVLVLGARQDAPALIRLMDVLVLTSLTEGFPNVLLEAIRAATPIVTTAAGGAAEVVVDGQTGFVVPCGDAAAVAARVLDLRRSSRPIDSGRLSDRLG